MRMAPGDGELGPPVTLEEGPAHQCAACPRKKYIVARLSYEILEVCLLLRHGPGSPDPVRQITMAVKAPARWKFLLKMQMASDTPGGVLNPLQYFVGEIT